MSEQPLPLLERPCAVCGEAVEESKVIAWWGWVLALTVAAGAVFTGWYVFLVLAAIIPLACQKPIIKCGRGHVLMLVLLLGFGACGPDIEPKRHNACAQAEQADDRNEAQMTPDDGCHICYEVYAARAPGETQTKFGCDCEVDNCGYWAPADSGVEWVNSGSIKWEDDHQAACDAVPIFADELTCSP